MIAILMLNGQFYRRMKVTDDLDIMPVPVLKRTYMGNCETEDLEKDYNFKEVFFARRRIHKKLDRHHFEQIENMFWCDDPEIEMESHPQSGRIKLYWDPSNVGAQSETGEA